MPRPLDLEETAPATGLSTTPGDYGFPAGTRAGRYVLGERLGAGGMGVVYAARDAKLDRAVALKLLRPDAGGVGEPRDHLVHEAQALARLAHPNVVTVFDVGDFEGRVYVAMELVKGATLSRWLARGGRTWQEVLGVFVQAGRGLAAAHAVGIVHRDFKPDNVLVGDDGRVRVADFGIARLALGETASAESGERSPSRDESGSTPRGALRTGTPAYMAPEQRRDGIADARSDQYSFCMALHEAIYGHRPDADARGARESTWPPEWLAPLIARGLATEPDARYASMDALLDVLVAEPRRRRQRARLATAGLAATALLATGIAWGSARATSRSAQLCRGSEAKLAGVWDEPTAAAAERAFSATGKPFAGDAWRGVKTTLDAYAKEWVATRTETCVATRVRGEQSDQILGLRMACLDDRLQALGALTQEFTHADGRGVGRAFSAAQALPRLASCSDAKWLLARVKPPADPEVAARVRDLRARIARVKALDDLGQYKEGLALARAVVANAETVDDAAVQATALYREGNLLGRTGQIEEAEPVLRRAAAKADAAGDDAERVKAYGALLFFLGGEQMKAGVIEGLEEEARGALARLGSDDDAEANFMMGLGAALNSAGRAADARIVDEKVIAIETRMHGPASWQVGIASSNLAGTIVTLGEFDRAADIAQHALGIIERELGGAHPAIADPEATTAVALLGNGQPALAEPHIQRAVAIAETTKSPDVFVEYLYGLGDVLAAEGKLDAALATFQRALGILKKNHPDDDPILRFALTGVGENYAALGKPASAIPYLEQALALPKGGDESVIPRTQLALARTLPGTPANHARARKLVSEAKEALASSPKGPGDAERLGAAEAWLAANP